MFYQNKRFYENLGRDIPDPREFIKKKEFWFWLPIGGGERVYGGERFLGKTTHAFGIHPEQLTRGTTLPWSGTGLSL